MWNDRKGGKSPGRLKKGGVAALAEKGGMGMAARQIKQEWPV